MPRTPAQARSSGRWRQLQTRGVCYPRLATHLLCDVTSSLNDLPTPERWMGAAKAVMDAVGSSQ